MTESLQIPPPSAVRDELEKLVLADLHGPAGGPDEELDEASVSERYLVGMLAPKRNPAVVDWIVTLFLVNGQKEQERLNDEQWLFQPELAVEAADGSAAFVKRAHFHDPQKADPVSMNEERMMAMAYRHQSEFAVGHNVAV